MNDDDPIPLTKGQQIAVGMLVVAVLLSFVYSLPAIVRWLFL